MAVALAKSEEADSKISAAEQLTAAAAALKEEAERRSADAEAKLAEAKRLSEQASAADDEAASRLQAAEIKAAEAEQRAADAELKLAEADMRAAGADARAQAAEQKASEAQKLADEAAAKSADAEKKLAEAEALKKEAERLSAEAEAAKKDAVALAAASSSGSDAVVTLLETKAAEAERKAAEAEKRASEAEKKAADAVARAEEAERKAKAAEGMKDAGDAQLKIAAEAAARADSLAAEAESLKARIAELESKIAELESGRDVMYDKLASFGKLRIDSSAFKEQIRVGFDGSTPRLGTWKIKDGILSQTNSKQFFSRLTFPLTQSARPVLYSFETKTGSSGWVGTGIHLFAAGVKKTKGYGEGKSLLVWLTRDEKTRGNSGTYLQVYRSDDDVNMERVLDAKIKEKLDAWNKIEILYEPADEFIVIAVNGSIRAAYRTYFGIGAGVSMSLRTLGAGVQFRNLEVRR
jgi:chemotaxis protein histidine kinase CheA